VTRASLVAAAALTVAASAVAPGPAAAQTLAGRIAAAPDGTVHLSYAAREGVCGNGAGNISLDCRNGRCGGGIRDDAEWVAGTWNCEEGPVRLALSVRGGRVSRIRVFVGGRWREATGATDLGAVPAAEAAHWLLSLARSGEGRAPEQAIFPAILADSIVVWPDLLRLARDAAAPSRARDQAVFWLGQAAGEAATKDLADLAADDTVDRDVREHAVFALSQQPRDVGVPALLRIARTNRDPEVRRRAFFWLAQTHDPRALALFEEVLTAP
jgi:hypothetical protein